MSTKPSQPGRLYVVATPIGNLEDFSPRAARVLAEVDLVLAEDTRHSGRLLKHFGIATPLRSCHDYNERARVEGLLARLREGASLALVSDAGTPLVSDPGFHLVRAARQAGIEVCAVPGPSAVTAALSICGLPTDRFVFEGFLPARPAARAERLRELGAETRTLVLFESPHRIVEALGALAEAFGPEREAVLVREATKLHEETLGGSLGELRERLAADPVRCCGEMVLVVHGAAARAPELTEAGRLLALLLEALPPGQAAALVSRYTGLPRRTLYALALGRPGGEGADVTLDPGADGPDT